MTVAGKINSLVIVVFVTAGLLVTSHMIAREYTFQRDLITSKSAAIVLSHPHLQMAVYFNDRETLDEGLEKFLAMEAVRQAQVLDPAGNILASKTQKTSLDYAPLALSAARSGLSAVDAGTTQRKTDVLPQGHELLAKLLGGESITDLTIPVFSAFNFSNKNITRSDFGVALANPGSIESLHVIGYVHLAVSRTMILAGIMPFVTLALGAYILLILLSSLLTIVVSRRITAPLTKLARIADNIASGEIEQGVTIQGSGEIKEIATVLNTIIGGINNYKTQMDVDHQLLSMKVEERTVQLSKRNKELNQAVREVTETKDRLRKLAYFDSLTSLPNRRLFTEQLNLLLRIAKRKKHVLALLFLDLDNFKRINDSLGHSAGDLLLREVASRLSSCIRDSDVIGHNVDGSSTIDVSRLGGDEFTVVLNEIDKPEAAAVVAQRLIDALASPMIIEGHELVVTPSIGIAIAPRDANDVEGLLKAADTAMYHAKSTGKNNYLYYSSDMDAAGVERLKLETDLRKAVELDQLAVHFQPQVDTATGNVVGAEALLRWEHPEQGMIPPFKFIPLAEEMGLIGELGDWTLVEACRQLVKIQNEGLQLPKVAVNVSALQLNSTFIDRVAEVLRETGLTPSALELELTEGIAMDNASSTVDALRELKAIGVSLSIDDFGTGYSSLSYLSRFPLNELKIDRSFVTDFSNSENDASLVIAIIAMGKSMNLNLVAEGVETHEQYHFLTSNGANVIQGYLFSRPVPVRELKRMLYPGHFLSQIKKIPAQHAAIA